MVLVPTGEWILRGDDISELEWLNESIPRPSDTDIAMEMARLDSIEPTIEEKLNQVGLSISDLKNALGL
jgi:hypothetical protein